MTILGLILYIMPHNPFRICPGNKGYGCSNGGFDQ